MRYAMDNMAMHNRQVTMNKIFEISLPNGKSNKNREVADITIDNVTGNTAAANSVNIW